MKRGTMVLLALVILLVLWPAIMSEYAVVQANRAMIYSLLALSFSILAGHLGWFSLCQNAFAGVSGYTVAILSVQYGLSFPIVLAAALMVSLLFAVAFGLLTVRAKGVSFLMLTLALGQMVWALSLQWVDVTGGYNGISGVGLPTYAGIDFGSHRVFYAILAIFTLLTFLGVRRLYRSPFGLLLLGIQENEQRMRALGHPVHLARFVAFMLSGLIAGMAGIFLVYDVGIMTPSPLDLGHAVWVLAAAVLGGYRTLWGPALGVVILIALEVLVSQYTDRYMMVTGLVLLLSVLLMPRGLAEFLERHLDKAKPSASKKRERLSEEKSL